MGRQAILRAAAVIFVAIPAAVTAHPAARARLELLNERIAAAPRDAAVYLERGQVYRHAGEWEAALADYERAAELGIDPDAADLARGELLLQAGRAPAAMTFLDRLVARRPDHPGALQVRARARSALGRAAAAADDFSRALDLLQLPATPDLYLEAIRALARAGRVEEALSRADEGLERLGPLSVLAAEAIELEIDSRRYPAALERLDRIASSSPFAERWLVRRAEVLELAGRSAAACAAYETASAALARRGANRRSTRVLTEIGERIHDGRERLAGGYGECD